MSTLRFLLIHRDTPHAARLAALLGSANHSVLATSGLVEASEAVWTERFDAILLDARLPLAEVAEFTSALRQAEEVLEIARIPVVSLLDETAEEPVSNAVWDECLREPLDTHALTNAVTRLAQAVGHPNSQLNQQDVEQLPVLDPLEFEEQLGGDRELMVEIIDLFLVERQRQLLDMRRAVAEADYAQLSRLAHTIKGSFGSLHAARAHWRAQELESAAAAADLDRCRQSLHALEEDLAVLEPELRSLRQLAATL